MSGYVKELGNRVKMETTTYLAHDKWETILQMRVTLSSPGWSTAFVCSEELKFNNGMSNGDTLDLATRSLWNKVQRKMKETLTELNAIPTDEASLYQLMDMSHDR